MSCYSRIFGFDTKYSKQKKTKKSSSTYVTYLSLEQREESLQLLSSALLELLSLQIRAPNLRIIKEL